MTVDTTAGSGGTAGTVTLSGSISLNEASATDAALLTVTGGGNIVLTTSLTIDTENGDTGSVTNVGGVNFGTSAVSANAVGVDLTHQYVEHRERVRRAGT